MDGVNQQLTDDLELMEQLSQETGDKQTDNYVRCEKCGCAFFAEYSLEKRKQDGIILHKEDDTIKRDYRAADPLKSQGIVSTYKGLECSQCKTWYVIDKQGKFIQHTSEEIIS